MKILLIAAVIITLAGIAGIVRRRKPTVTQQRSLPQLSFSTTASGGTSGSVTSQGGAGGISIVRAMDAGAYQTMEATVMEVWPHLGIFDLSIPDEHHKRSMSLPLDLCPNCQIGDRIVVYVGKSDK